MPAGLKVTYELFKQIKDELRYSEPLTVAIKNHMSVKTILQVKGSQEFRDYEAMKKAQHPPTKFSMRDMLESMDIKLDNLIAATKENTLL